MNDRLVSLLGALLAILVVAGVLGPGTSAHRPQSLPTSIDEGEQGLAAVTRWLADAAQPVHSLRYRYNHLPVAAQGSGNLLLTVVPQHTPARTAELNALAAWARAGNTVLVLIEDGDAEVRRFLRHLDLGVENKAPAKATIRDAVRAPGSWKEAAARGAHPLTAGLRSIRLAGEQAEPPTVTAREEARLVLPLLEMSGRLVGQASGATPGGPRERAEDWTDEGARPVLWLARLGAGRVIVLFGSAPFTNRGITQGDNAALFDRLIAYARGGAGRVVFDDMHQGLSALYDARALAADWRSHASLAILAGVWLLWIVGHGNRFGPVERAEPGESSADYARTVGGFMAREGRPASVASAMIEQFERYCRNRHPARFRGRSLESVLEQHPRIPAGAVEEFIRARRAIAAGEAPDVLLLATRIHRLKERL